MGEVLEKREIGKLNAAPQVFEVRHLAWRSLLSGPRKVSIRAVEFVGRRELVIEYLKRPEPSFWQSSRTTCTRFIMSSTPVTLSAGPSSTMCVVWRSSTTPVFACVLNTRSSHSTSVLSVWKRCRTILCASPPWTSSPPLSEGKSCPTQSAVRPGSVLGSRTVTLRRGRLAGSCAWWSRTLRDSYVDNLAQEFLTSKDHTTRAQNQHRVVRQLREHMSPAECTIQMDFAENWMVSYPEEPQSVYYAKEPVTLHQLSSTTGRKRLPHTGLWPSWRMTGPMTPVPSSHSSEICATLSAPLCLRSPPSTMPPTPPPANIGISPSSRYFASTNSCFASRWPGPTSKPAMAKAKGHATALVLQRNGMRTWRWSGTKRYRTPLSSLRGGTNWRGLPATSVSLCQILYVRGAVCVN